MKRGREDAEEEEEEIDTTKKKEEQTELVFALAKMDDGDSFTCSAQLTEAEIALLVPKFVDSGPIDRCDEVNSNGPAARALKKFYKYVEYDQGTDVGHFLEGAPITDVSTVDLANTRARTIVWFGYQ